MAATPPAAVAPTIIPEAAAAAPVPPSVILGFDDISVSARTLLQEARALGLDVRSYGKDVTDAVLLLRQGDRPGAERAMNAMHERLQSALRQELAQRLASAKSRRDRLAAFVTPAPGEVLVGQLDAALAAGEYAEVRLLLDDLSLVLRGGEADLGPLGKILQQMDQLMDGVAQLAGSAQPEESLLHMALEAGRGGDRAKAEALLRDVSLNLSNQLGPLLAETLAEVSKELQRQRDRGRDIRHAATLLKEMAAALRSKKPAVALQLLPKLREDVKKGEREFAERSPPPKPAAETQGARVRAKARTVAADGTTSTGAPASAASAPAAAAPAPAPSPPAPSHPPPKPGRAPARPGHTYLVLENRPREAGAIFRELTGKYPGLFLTTQFPPKLIEIAGLKDTPVVWLSESSGWEDSLNPKTLEHEVAARVNRFLKGERPGALGLDGISFLISVNTLEKVEKFLKITLDLASSRGVGVVACLPPDAVEQKARAHLEALFDEVVTPG